MTTDDQNIWIDLGDKPCWFPIWPLEERYLEQDRRDAELMASAQAMRVVNGRDHILQFGELLFCGCLVRFTGLDELESFL